MGTVSDGATWRWVRMRCLTNVVSDPSDLCTARHRVVAFVNQGFGMGQ